MARTWPFERHTNEYEEWFEKNRGAYLSEIDAVRSLMPKNGKGLEIGVGSGRFAKPLGIRTGIEPSERMAEIARERGIKVFEGTAEDLPFGDSTFDIVLMVTTICFVDDVDEAIAEAYRVLRPSGCLIVGFVDRKSPVGRSYMRHKDQSIFYKDAAFFSVEEVARSMERAGFSEPVYAQTIFRPLSEIEGPEPVRRGYGEGSFVVVRAVK
ncbi:MAG: class I SAM-dependent methyltransferase [Thermoplasmatota archaeon]